MGRISQQQSTEYMRMWREKNRERHNTYMRGYYAKNRKHICRWQQQNRIKRKYGITDTEYEAIIERQGGGCALCGSRQKKYRLPVDHDHSTGRVRGVLCIPCNRALGSFGDTVEALERVVRYLKGEVL